jgi:hypothetical protein
MRIAIIALVIFLSGCALAREIHDGQQLANWARDNEPLAESGSMKWSEYYAEYYRKVAATPSPDQARVAERLGILIAASLFYEQGRLDKAGFDSVRRVIRTYETIDDAAANALGRDALVRALQRPAIETR